MTPTTNPPRPLLQRPLLLILVRVLLPLLALAAIALMLWLHPQGETPAGTSLKLAHDYDGAYAAIPCILVIIASGLFSCFTRRYERISTFIAWAGSLAASIALFCFSDVADNLMASDLLWDVPFICNATLCFGLITPLILTLWQAVARPIKPNLSPVLDASASLLCMFAVFFGGPICAHLLFAIGVQNEAVWITVCVSYIMILLAGVLHLCWIIGSFHLKRLAAHTNYRRGWTFIAAFLLPLLGLLLNRTIPFPGDFQSPWSYILTTLTALVLLLPDSKGLFGKLIAMARWATFPFTLYFFIVFLPFMPLAIPGMLIFGLGILLLAPTALLSIHLPALRHTSDCFTTRWARITVAIGCSLILPLLFLASIERDRANVRPLITAIAEPDTTAPSDTLPMEEAAAKRVAEALLDRNYNQGFPLLRLWADYRLFDGMAPRADILESLMRRFNLENDDRLFICGRRAQSPWRQIRAKTATVETDLRGVGTTQLTVAVTIPQLESAEEFRAPIKLDDGVWITGLRLKMPNEGPWRDGLLCDRRAATWIYERLTEKNIDPALLTLDTLTQGTLRVSPVNEPRHVEIDLLMPSPTWSSTPITIGEVAVTVPGVPTPEVKDSRPTATVCFIGPKAEAPLPAATLYVTATPLITVSESAPETLPTEGGVDVPRALRFAQGAAYARNLRLTEAHFVGEGWETATFIPEPPRRALPTLPPDSPWQQGAQAAQLSEVRLHAPHPEYLAPLREAMKASKALMPRFAYIVVETEAQERALRTLDAIANQADAAMDFDTPVKQSAPAFLLLLLPLLPLMLRKGTKS